MNKTIINPLKNIPETTLKPHSNPAPQDRWSRDQHIELVNIIGEPTEGMLVRSMAAKLTATSASECLFANFLSKVKPKKVSEALKHPGWVDAMMEAIRIFLAFATYMNFKVFQMDVKSAFLNGKLKEEVYVKQPPGFESSEFPKTSLSGEVSHPAKAETQGVTSWISSQHNGVNNKESLHA
ncbi:retrovirus-related pol polyprotein from transposon TNT 1-94 [Tanacetum coccineum]